MKWTKNQRLWIHRFAWVLFIIYTAVMAYFLFFSEEFNRTGGSYEYNLVLLKEIKRGFWCLNNGRESYFLINVVMNVAAFMPFGFILPIISSKNRKFLNILILGFELTLMIELLQLFLKVGCFDVDDLLLNTIGAVLGYAMFKICQLIGKDRRHDQ